MYNNPHCTKEKVCALMQRRSYFDIVRVAFLSHANKAEQKKYKTLTAVVLRI